MSNGLTGKTAGSGDECGGRTTRARVKFKRWWKIRGMDNVRSFAQHRRVKRRRTGKNCRAIKIGSKTRCAGLPIRGMAGRAQ